MNTSNAPKFLKELAVKITKEDQKEYSFITEDNFDSWVEDNLKELLAVREALLQGRYYTRVDSVSKSGMSRTIVIKYIKDNKLHGVSDFIYKLAGCDKNHRIGGCGMDMLFQAKYNLFVTLCPNHKYKKPMPSYNNL